MNYPERFNLADYFLDERIREGRGDRPAILYRDEVWTYAEVQAAANRMANVLRDVGVEVEDRVLIVLPDCPLFAAAFFGVLKVGAVVTMANSELPLDDYYYYLSYTRARAVVCDAALAPLLGALGVRHLGAVLARDGGLEEALARAPAAFENEPTSPDDLAIWLFTSGSTGKPKAAVHMHHDFAFSTEHYAKQVMQIREDDVTLSVPKLFFGYATGTNLMFPFAVGARTVLFEEKSTPERMFDLIARYRPTILTSVPTMIGKMLATPGAAERPMDSLRVTISAGEALPEELYRRWTETFASEILDGIGSAELFHIYISNRFGEVRPGTLGKIVPGYEAKILDDDGNELPPGEIGTLWVKGDSAALCYFQAHEKSKEVLRGDWVVSGDKFFVDTDGYFHYAGRTDDLLKVAGIFVAPVEVEAVLMQHPGVLECVVVGYEEEDKLVKPKAVVVPKPGWRPCDALVAELLALARSKLVHYKVPRKIEFRDALPRSDRGKILRREVK
ncbi:MAG TPA: benzoate-CoA ligase family protein [Haliangiales bacterium]|nr:benzoate-CoA ligase family protein [Haliangiales bacterium]